jgi:peptide/nickel transport system substrate-binding protein
LSSYYPYGIDPDLAACTTRRRRRTAGAGGYPNGFDFTLVSGSDQPELAEAIAAYWGQVGVRTKINRMDYTAGSARTTCTRSGPATISQFANAIFDPIHVFYGSAAKDGTWSGLLQPVGVEALLEKASQVPDIAGRDVIFRRVSKISPKTFIRAAHRAVLRVRQELQRQLAAAGRKLLVQPARSELEVTRGRRI